MDTLSHDEHGPSRKGQSRKKRHAHLKAHSQVSVEARQHAPLELLRQQEEGRIAELLPVRYGRMAVSPFSFFRGAAIVMAQDLALAPSTPILVQACGDAHISNFGTFATPERAQVFDLNDFDETTLAPWDWDVKRLVASVMLAARECGWADHVAIDAVFTTAAAYKDEIDALAHEGFMAVHYARIRSDELLSTLEGNVKKKVARYFMKARLRDSLQALEKLAVVSWPAAKIVDSPPLISHSLEPAMAKELMNFVERYRKSLAPNRAGLLEQFTAQDIARKVVGVGSVGTHCYAVLLSGRDLEDPLFLQIKEAFPSVLERYTQPSTYQHHGERVVVGQRTMQSASDIFLGFGQIGNRHFYVRQLRDMKGSIDLERASKKTALEYVELCGRALAMAHGRSGAAQAITGYIGTSEVFETALTSFARRYADQTERDHQELVRAIRNGRVHAVANV